MITLTQRVDALKKVFRHIRVSRDGCDVAVPCPICKTPDKLKLSVNIETLQYHCWVCGAKGSKVTRLVRDHVGESESSWLAESLGEELGNVSQHDEDPEPVADLPEKSTPLVICDSKDPNFRAVKRYCERRGLSESDLWRYRICWSSED